MAISIAVTGSLSVSAAGLRDIFNAKYYADSNPDVKEAFGYDEESLYQHYLTFGLSEGRAASPVFDVVAYREMYGDLDEAFGDNWDAYVEHYFTYGVEEHRVSGGTFDPIAYAEAYPDVKEAFGDDYEAIIEHFLNFGIAEGRTAGVTVETEPEPAPSPAPAPAASSSPSPSPSAEPEEKEECPIKIELLTGSVYGVEVNKLFEGSLTMSIDAGNHKITLTGGKLTKYEETWDSGTWGSGTTDTDETNKGYYLPYKITCEGDYKIITTSHPEGQTATEMVMRCEHTAESFNKTTFTITVGSGDETVTWTVDYSALLPDLSE